MTNGNNTAWPRLIIAGLVSMFFGMLGTTLVASLTFWRDFTLVQERQGQLIIRVQNIEQRLNLIESTNVAQDKAIWTQQMWLDDTKRRISHIERRVKMREPEPEIQ